MQRYIEAYKLIADIKEVADITDGKLTEFEILGILSGQPTADVVEVVRCKDCVNYIGTRCHVANHHVAEFEDCMSVFRAKRKE